MLEVKNLRKTFGDVVAVDGIDFTIKPGEIMGLIGQNGSGKTTTFRMILDLMHPDSGTATWNGETFNEEFYNQVGFLPEERGLDDKQTVEQQILYFAALRGKDPKEIKPKIDEWLERFRVKGKKTDPIKNLSKGNQQKVQVIITLIHEPDLIILDEPFSGLDPVNAELLEEGIRDARDRGAAIIFSSHNMNNVEELCDSFIMIHNGKQVLGGEVMEVRRSFGRTELFLESSLSREELEAVSGVESVKDIGHGVFEIHLNDEEAGKEIFELASRDGFIPTFSQQPPTLDAIFKRTAGELNE